LNFFRNHGIKLFSKVFWRPQGNYYFSKENTKKSSTQNDEFFISSMQVDQIGQLMAVHEEAGKDLNLALSHIRFA